MPPSQPRKRKEGPVCLKRCKVFFPSHLFCCYCYCCSFTLIFICVCVLYSTEQEFNKISSIIKGRTKLDDLNKVYRCIFDVFNKGKRSLIQPLSVKELSKTSEKRGVIVTGHSGESKLSTLRSLHIIELTSKGILLYGAKK